LNSPSNLKIFGGTARGRRLDSPSVYLRPMMGKVREAVYSTLTSFGLYDFPDVRHLDCFAGSGSVGLESLSRGARHCTFCDLSQDCCNAIERNIQWCQFDNGEDHTTQVVCSDVLQLLRDPVAVGIPEGETFGIVTICPPYEEVVYADLLDAVANSPAVTEDTIVLMEYPVELWGELPHVYSGETTTMIRIRNRKYGRTVIAMYICNPTGRIEDAESRPEEFV
jgi:16S rRNA (guanine966-N2)-methyltransferase